MTLVGVFLQLVLFQTHMLRYPPQLRVAGILTLNYNTLMTVNSILSLCLLFMFQFVIQHQEQEVLNFQFVATVAAYYVMIQDLSAGQASCVDIASPSVAPGNVTNTTVG